MEIAEHTSIITKAINEWDNRSYIRKCKEPFEGYYLYLKIPLHETVLPTARISEESFLYLVNKLELKVLRDTALETFYENESIPSKRTAMQELIDLATVNSKREGDSGFVGRSVLAWITQINSLEKEKKQLLDSYKSGANDGMLHIYGDVEPNPEKYISEIFNSNTNA